MKLFKLACVVFLLLTCNLVLMKSVGYAESTVLVTSPEGNETNLNINQSTLIIAMASWCPHCHDLSRFLADPVIKQYLNNNHVYLVFGDEWPRMGKFLKEAMNDKVKQGKLPSNEYNNVYNKVLSGQQAEAGNGPVYDPKFLSSLPYPYVFAIDKSNLQSPITKAIYPSAFNELTGQFNGDYLDWIQQHSNIPEDLLNKKARQYKLIE